jgi:AraC-like DNA-binding protein
MIKSIFDILMISGIILGIIFIVTTQLSKKGKDKSMIYLSLVVLFLTLNNLQICLVDNDYVNVNFFIRKLLIPWYVLIMPSFYTFLSYYLKVEKKIYSFFILSISLFVLEIMIRMAFIPYFYPDKNNYVVAKFAQIEEIVNALYTLFLFIKAFVLLFSYSKLYQYVLTFDNIKWLKNFMFLGSIVLLMWVCAIVLNLDKVLNPQIYIYYPMRLSCSVLLYWIGYQGFYNYSLMAERIQLRKVIVQEEGNRLGIVIPDSNVIVTNKSASNRIETNVVVYSQPAVLENFVTINNNFSEEIKDDKFSVIKKYIVDNKRFLDPAFSLEHLASELKMSTSTLSQLINQKSGYNFSDYINQLRVEKAKKYLTLPEYKNYTIVVIGLECGFNSKSTFYTAFKKFTKTTPTEFKKTNS